LLQGVRGVDAPAYTRRKFDFVDGPISPNKSKMVDSGYLEIRKMFRSGSAPNLVGRCTTAMRR